MQLKARNVKFEYRSFVRRNTEMITLKLIGPNTGLTGALLVGLLSQQAAATEELVVYGTATTAAVSADHRLFQSEVAQYIRSFNEQLRTSLDQDLKRQLAPKLELASSVIQTRG
jgi:hypothetical protein